MEPYLEVGIAKKRPSLLFRSTKDICEDALLAQMRLTREYFKALEKGEKLSEEEIDRIIGSCGFNYTRIGIPFDQRYFEYKFPTDKLYG